MDYDVIIVGMGIAGISAAIYAKNSGMRVLLLECDTPGGLLNKINSIENYPGYSSVSGPDLAFELYQSVNKLKIPFKIAKVLKIEVNGDKKIVKTSTEEIGAKYVILATGRENRRLGIEHEKELLGRGISTCALCDGNLYKDQEIALVGGGNSALEEALYLSNIVSKVYLIHRRDTFRAEEHLVEQVKSKENIEILFNSQVTSFVKEKDALTGIVVNEKETIPVSALFTYVGFVPSNQFVEDLGILDETGYIFVDKNYETKASGIYAVGDCIKKEVYQLITAANDGVMAAIHIIKNKEK